MGKRSLQLLVRHLRKCTGSSIAAEPSDQELLNRFIERHDEAAFALLVRRHGAMVRDLCWRRLGQEADVDDASQAVFLVLARKAHSIRKQQSLASWLYGVAWRVAERAKKDAARQRRYERVRGEQRVAPDPARDAAYRDLCTALDAELSGLSDKYRAPLVLCYLESRTRDEAARQLGLSLRTLDRRLERGRELLRKRLERGGLTLSAAMLVAGLSQAKATGLRSSLEAMAACAAAASAVGRMSARAQVLAEGALKAMAAAKPHTLVVWALGLTIAAAGAGMLAPQGRNPADEGAQGRAVPSAAASPTDQAAPDGAVPARTDLYGDPLPAAALYRLGTLRFRHEGDAWGVAFSPDGKIVAATTWNGLIYLWDAASGKEIRRLRMAESQDGNYVFSSMNFFPDGRTLYATDAQGMVRYWDMATGKQLQQFTAFKEQFPQERFPTALSPDGKVLAVAGRAFVDGKIKARVNVFDAATGKALRTLEVAKGDISAICFSPDSRFLVGQWSMGWDAEVKLWEVATGRLSRVIRQRPGRPAGHAFAFSRDGQVIAWGSKEVWLLEAATGKELGKLETKLHILMSLAFTPDGKRLVFVSQDGKVHCWDVETRKERFTRDARTSLIRSMAMSRDGKTIALGSVGNAIRLWDVATGKEQFTQDQGHDAPINSVAYSPEGKILATGGDNRQIRLWEPRTQKLLRRFNSPNSARSVAFSPDGKQLASAWPTTKAIRLWDVVTGEVKRELQHDGLGCKCAAFSPDGTRLISAHADLWHSTIRPCSLRLWDLTTGLCRREFSMKSGSLECLAYSPDGKTVAVGTGNGLIYVWDVHAWRQVWELRGHEHSVGGVVFAPDSRTLVSGSTDQTVRLWDLSTGRQTGVLRGHERAVMAVACSPDGRLIASAGGTVHHPTKTSGPQRIRIWELASAHEVLRLQGHDSNVNGLAFHPRGRQLACGLVNGTSLVWDLVPPRSRRAGAPAAQAPNLASLWADLANADAGRAYEALWMMVRLPEKTIPFLKEHLQPVKQDRQIAELIADLDNGKFAVREVASKQLERLLPGAEPALRRALARGPTEETRRRLDALLLTSTGIVRDAEALRGLRAIAVLEHITGSEAEAVLRKISGGTPEARLTRDAKISLDRLHKGAVLSGPAGHSSR